MWASALGRPKVDREIQTRTAHHIFEVLGAVQDGATERCQPLAIYELARRRIAPSPTKSR
ncbi:hypothetical protein ACW2Q0_01370 [Nocardia sp. R16R-3T]